MIINSCGLFKETQTACVLEAILNLVISLILVKPLGILGVLIGTFLSKLLITTIQYPTYIMKNVFKRSVIRYLINYFLVLAINLVFVFALHHLVPTVDSILTWFLYVVLFAVIVAILLFIIYFIIFRSFKLLTNRGLDYIKSFINKKNKKTA